MVKVQKLKEGKKLKGLGKKAFNICGQRYMKIIFFKLKILKNNAQNETIKHNLS